MGCVGGAVGLVKRTGRIEDSQRRIEDKLDRLISSDRGLSRSDWVKIWTAIIVAMGGVAAAVLQGIPR